MSPDKQAVASKYASLSDDERMSRLLEIADLRDAEAHLEEFAFLLCGQEIKFSGAPGEQAAAEAQIAGK